MFRKAQCLAMLVFLAGAFSGCGEDVEKPHSLYLYGNTPAALLQDFRTAWDRRDITRYSELLADDFRFYFDAGTRQERGLPEYWDRETDITQVGKLFSSSEINDIRLSLTFNPTPVPHGVNPGWESISVTDEYLEVERQAMPGETEGITLIVDGQIQKFAFRKGRMADSLGLWPSHQYYIVEWRDQGLQWKPTDGAIESSTWGRIKSLFAIN